MSNPKQPCIFLSYCRTDLDAALELRQRIEAELGEGTVWHDVRDLGGEHWWSEIDDAIRGKAAVEHVVLLASADALARPVVRREWLLAWREGKALTNVFWSARPGFAPPPLGEQQDFVRTKSMLDLSLPDRWSQLIMQLKGPGQSARRPFMAPAMPEGFVARPEEFAKLKTALLDAVSVRPDSNNSGNAVAITAALRGAGGFGKTVMAQALAHSDEVYEQFHDGVLWVTLGERPSLIEKLADLLNTLTGEPQGFTEVSAAANKLREVLAERKCLLVIDDVWSESHLRPFIDGAPLTARLVTTRRDDILPKGAVRVAVDAMKATEAVELLSQGLGDIGAVEQSALRTLATKRLNEWPVIIRLVNGFLRKEVERGATPREAIQQANDRLDRKKLTVFDRTDEKAREAAVESTIRASVDYLVEEIGKGQDAKVYNGQRYDELAVFPEDIEVPIATIARLWGGIAQVDEIDARDLLKHLYSLALLQALDLKRGTVRLHDVMRKYLYTKQQAANALQGLHHQFVMAYDAESGEHVSDMGEEERRYFYSWFPTHLREAGERVALDELLLDPRWMQRKFDALGAPDALVGDYERLVLDRQSLHGLIGRTLRLSSGILGRDKRQLLTQLHGRLLDCKDPAASPFLAVIRRQMLTPTLMTICPSLTPPSAETIRLEHGGCMCSLPDGRLASMGGNEIVIWDAVSGAEAARIKTAGTCLVALPDGRLATGGRDSVSLWDTTSGVEAFALYADGDVTSICAMSGHRLAAGCDKSIYVWDLTARAKIHDLWVGARIDSLLEMPDGRLVSGSHDYTIRLWDLDNNEEVKRIDAGSGLESLVILPDGRLASGNKHVIQRRPTMRSDHKRERSDHDSIRIWDLESGTETSRLKGHDSGTGALAVLPDNRLASGGQDNTIRLWNLSTYEKFGELDGHSGGITALCSLSNGRLASTGYDSTIRIWELPKDARRNFGGHTRAVTDLCQLPDGRLASASHDGTIRLWDISSCTEVGRLEGHKSWVNGLCMADGRLVSGSSDVTIRIWDLRSNSQIGDLDVGIGSISHLCQLPDNRLAVTFETWR